MSRPQRTAAARTRSYHEASDSDDHMQEDDEAPLSTLYTRSSRSSTATSSRRDRETGGLAERGQSRGYRTQATAQLNDEIDNEDEEDGTSTWHSKPQSRTARHNTHNSTLPFELQSKEEVLVLDDDGDEEQAEEEEEEELRKPQQRPRRSSSANPRPRQHKADPLQEEVEDDDEEAEFEHEKALLQPQRNTRNNRSSPSPPTQAERILSSGIELRRRRANVDYRKTKIDRQSFFTPDAWTKADKQQNGASQSMKGRGGKGGGEKGRRKKYEDDLFEPDEEAEEAEEEEEEADNEAEVEEVEEEDEDDVLAFSHLQRGSRRSERTLGKKVDYSSHALDEAVRSALHADDRNSRKPKQSNTEAKRQNGRRRNDTEQMDEEADEHTSKRAGQDGSEQDDEVQPMTDSDAEGYEGRRGRKQQDGDELEVAEDESPEETAFRLQAEQYMSDGLIPTKLLALRRVADNSATNSLPPPSSTAHSSASSSSLSVSSLHYLVKWKDRAYKHSTWVDERVLEYFPNTKSQMTRLKNTLTQSGVDIHSLSVYKPEQRSQQEDGSVIDDSEVELEDNQYYNPDFTQVHRIVSHRKHDDKYLVKWKGLGYDELTWESVADIDNDAEIERYHRYSQLPGRTLPTLPRRLPQPTVRKMVDGLTFENGRELREYQKEGVSWMCFNWLQGQRPSLLADEMGLGKTAQAIAVCRFMQQYYHVRGPFLVVTPLSTVGHWQREFETWTDMNAVVFHGTQEARAAIERYEFHMFECDGKPRRHRSLFRFNALIVPDSIVNKERRQLCSSQ